MENIVGHDWEQYRDKRVLVRGCGDMIVPPWAYMAITARLAGIARSVRYGNEHDNILVYKSKNRTDLVSRTVTPGDSTAR